MSNEPLTTTAKPDQTPPLVAVPIMVGTAESPTRGRAGHLSSNKESDFKAGAEGY
jgi:hypothetical protein